MIAIGSSIGTGLFLGAGGRLATAGPSLFILYALCGFFGEMEFWFSLIKVGAILLFLVVGLARRRPRAQGDGVDPITSQDPGSDPR